MNADGELVLGFPLPDGPPDWDHADNTVGSGWNGGVNMSSKSSSGSWWSALGFGKAAPAPDTDYADMGTAFGLDASMNTPPMPETRADARDERSRPAAEGPTRSRKR